MLALLAGIALLVVGVWLEIELSHREPRPYQRGRGAPFAYGIALISVAFTPSVRVRRSRSDEIMARARRQHGLDRRFPWPTIVFVALTLSALAVGTWMLWPVFAR